MKTDEMISVTEFCTHHHVEISFIDSLNDSGLIELIVVNDQMFLQLSELSYLEKLVRLYYDMDINLEGIESIHHLLQRVNSMQEQILQLKNRLRIFELH